MNWHRGLFRLWVGGCAAWIAALLFGSVNSAVYTPQTNDASELLVVAGASLVVAIFGAWVLRGLKKEPRGN